MTVKEQLAARVARMSEAEAAETLRLIDQRQSTAVPSLRELLDRTQAAAGLSEAEAERVAYEELRAMRRERDGAA
ncbi:MAG: hypothetical protein M0P31_10220 [Solirubrobacteraceae bacterium]|nr:hypothetical protein [Solirubrobacteraceae bacterium]